MRRLIQAKFKMSRRSAIRLMGGVAGFAAVSTVGLGWFCSRRRDFTSTAVRLTWAFRESEGPVRVGQRYLARHPEEKDDHLLEKLIEDTYSLPSGLVTCSATAARALAAQSVQDFRARRVVWLDGWLLARTEARVCALMALRRRVVPA